MGDVISHVPNGCRDDARLLYASFCCIYHWNGLLFAYFEYIGSDYEADMAIIGSDPLTHEWWALNDPMQEPVQGSSTGGQASGWWTDMEEVFHTD